MGEGTQRERRKKELNCRLLWGGAIARPAGESPRKKERGEGVLLFGRAAAAEVLEQDEKLPPTFSL